MSGDCIFYFPCVLHVLKNKKLKKASISTSISPSGSEACDFLEFLGEATTTRNRWGRYGKEKLFQDFRRKKFKRKLFDDFKGKTKIEKACQYAIFRTDPAKLRMLKFYYDIVDEYFERNPLQLLGTKTGIVYVMIYGLQ